MTTVSERAEFHTLLTILKSTQQTTTGLGAASASPGFRLTAQAVSEILSVTTQLLLSPKNYATHRRNRFQKLSKLQELIVRAKSNG